MDNRILYLECYSGISGDMTVGALLDLGADQKVLLDALNSLQVTGYRVEISNVEKSGLHACDFNVIMDKEHENHDHDMGYLHGHTHEEHSHEHGDVHSHGEHSHEGHSHEGHSHQHADVHSHDHGIHLGHHEHRNLLDIEKIINAGELTPNAKAIATRIFQIIAEGESKAHGLPVDQVHFHEVGAVDSIVDIVAVAVCLDNLAIKKVAVSRLYEGQGHVRCQHGVLPIPVPAVSYIAAAYHLPLHIMDAQGEFVTPTGAAVAAGIVTEAKLPSDFSIEKIGIGAGKRTYEKASILRAMIINPVVKESENNTEDIWVLESNIDDSTGEALGYTMKQLINAGALDVYYSPIYMKKNRPAYMLSVVCNSLDRPRLEALIFAHTTTIGIRRHPVERTIMEREIRTIKTPLGDAVIKVCTYLSQTYCYPEYESVEKLALSNNIGYTEAYHIIKEAGSVR